VVVLEALVALAGKDEALVLEMEVGMADLVAKVDLVAKAETVLEPVAHSCSHRCQCTLS